MDDRARELNARIEDLRSGCHATYNGGHHDEPAYSAFHHGMDTICNVLAGGWLSAYGDEVREEERACLDRRVDGLERALKMRDTFLSGDAAASALQGVASYLDIMFTGAKGRQMTADEMIQEIKYRCDEVRREALERAVSVAEWGIGCDGRIIDPQIRIATAIRSLIKESK